MINLLWIIPATVLLLYVFFINGRSGHKGLAALRGKVFAHRGLHNADRPENSLSAFAAAKERGYGVELDLHLLRDGTLAVFHDHTLSRMTGADGKIEELTAEQLHDYHLNGTDQTIPTFDEVLAVFDDRVPLVVELKAAGNHRALVDAACKQLEQYGAPYCMESFDPRCLWFLRRRHPQIIRGQLSQDFMHAEEAEVKLSGPIKFILTHLLTNFLTRPDFVAYKFDDRRRLSVRLTRGLWRVQGAVWTLTDPAQHAAAVEEGLLPIFEQYEP